MLETASKSMQAALLPVERLARKSQRRALIKVGYSCNDHCVFCHTDDYRLSGDADTESVLAKIDRARLRGFDMVVLSGGEATMRPDLLQLTKHAAQRGLLLGFITNGRMMSYRQLVEKLVRHNLRYVHLSIHGPERVHNKCTGDRSFQQSFQGLQNLTGRGLDLTVNCVVVEQNRRALRELIDLILPFPDVMLKFSCCEPKGAALRHEEVVVPTLADASAAVVDALRYARDRIGDASGPRFAIENFPLCLMEEFHDLDDDLLANRLLVMSEVWDEDLVDIDDFNKVKPPSCSGCALWSSCPGVFVEYVRGWGYSEVRPVVHEAPRLADLPSVRGVPLVAPPDPSLPPGFAQPEEARIDLHPRYPDTALVTVVSPECDLACSFCTAAPKDTLVRPSSMHGVRASLRAMRTRCSAAVLGGGEPLSLTWMPQVIDYARSLGYSTVQLQTNAVAAARPGVAASLADAGLTAIDVPLHGGTARAHQAVTGTKGSFAAALAGISALRSRGVRVVVHATLSESTLGGLTAWRDLVLDLAPDAAYVQGISEVGGLSRQPEAGALRRALLGAFSGLEAPFPIALSDVPLCIVPELAHMVRPFAPEMAPAVVVLPYSDWLTVYTGGAGRAYAAGCAGCRARAECPGVAREALEAWGAPALRPLP